MQYCSYVSALVGVIIKEKLISCLKICPLYRDLLVRNSPGHHPFLVEVFAFRVSAKSGKGRGIHLSFKTSKKGICLKIKLSKKMVIKGQSKLEKKSG